MEATTTTTPSSGFAALKACLAEVGLARLAEAFVRCGYEDLPSVADLDDEEMVDMFDQVCEEATISPPELMRLEHHISAIRCAFAASALFTNLATRPWDAYAFYEGSEGVEPDMNDGGGDPGLAVLQLYSWLEGIGLGAYSDFLVEAGYEDLEQLIELTPTQVEEMLAHIQAQVVIPPGHLVKLRQNIAALQSSGSPVPIVNTVMIRRLRSWLSEIQLAMYAPFFVEAGYDDVDQIAEFTDNEVGEMLQHVQSVAPEMPATHVHTIEEHVWNLREAQSHMNSGPVVPETEAHHSEELVVQLHAWLREAGLEQYCDAFLDAGYDDLADIAELTWDEVNEMLEHIWVKYSAANGGAAIPARDERSMKQHVKDLLAAHLATQENAEEKVPMPEKEAIPRTESATSLEEGVEEPNPPEDDLGNRMGPIKDRQREESVGAWRRPSLAGVEFPTVFGDVSMEAWLASIYMLRYQPQFIKAGYGDIVRIVETTAEEAEQLTQRMQKELDLSETQANFLRDHIQNLKRRTSRVPGNVFVSGFFDTDQTEGRLRSRAVSENRSFQPVLRDLPPNSVVQVASGSDSVSVLTAGGSVFMWGGKNTSRCTFSTHNHGNLIILPCDSYCLGRDAVEAQDNSVPQTVGGIMNGRMVAVGALHTVLVTRSDEVITWGENMMRPGSSVLSHGITGQLGHDSEFGMPYVVENLLGIEIVAVACGAAHTCILSRDGRVYSFGANARGQLGHQNSVVSTSVPRMVEGITEVVRSLACGAEHSMATTASGGVWGWGDNRNGQLGISKSTPLHITYGVKVDLFGGAVFSAVQVACGACHTLVLTDRGDVFSCGRNDHGQLGHGDTKGLREPKMIEKLFSIVSYVSGGADVSACTTRGGDVYLWGQDRGKSPKLVKSMRDRFIRQVSCGRSHVVALDDSLLTSMIVDLMCACNLENSFDPSMILHYLSQLPPDLSCNIQEKVHKLLNKNAATFLKVRTLVVKIPTTHLSFNPTDDPRVFSGSITLRNHGDVHAFFSFHVHSKLPGGSVGGLDIRLKPDEQYLERDMSVTVTATLQMDVHDVPYDSLLSTMITLELRRAQRSRLEKGFPSDVSDKNGVRYFFSMCIEGFQEVAARSASPGVPTVATTGVVLSEDPFFDAFIEDDEGKKTKDSDEGKQGRVAIPDTAGPLYVVPGVQAISQQARDLNNVVRLFRAANHGDVDACENLLNNGTPLDSRDHQGNIPLHISALNGYEEAVLFFVQKDRDITNATNDFGDTPLHYATQNNHCDALRVLLDHGADVNVYNKKQTTPLHNCCRKGCLECVRLLLKHDADINVENELGQRPLHVAASLAYADIVFFLYQNGADLEAEARNKRKPLELASEDTLQALIQESACDTEEHATLVAAAEGIRRDYALIKVAREGNEDAVRKQLLEGARADFQTITGRCALHVAIDYGHSQIVGILLENGAPVSLRDQRGRTPLMAAVDGEKVEIVRLLLSKGSDVNAEDDQEYTPLHYAVQRASMDIVKILTEHGANLNAINKAGWSAVQYCFFRGHEEIAIYLLTNHAQLMKTDSDVYARLQNALTDKSFNAEFARYKIEYSDLKYKKTDRLGKGGAGSVFRGMYKDTEVAIKKFSKKSLSWDQLEQFFNNEVSILSKCNHPNVVLFMGVVIDPQHPCLVTEFLDNGSLFDVLQSKDLSLSWKMKIHMAIDASCGMNYLHSRTPNVIHLDLKTGNLLVDKNFNVKVTDFNVSKLLSSGLTTREREEDIQMPDGYSPSYVAPEILRGTHYTDKADVYSFGVILWEILTREIPWRGKNIFAIMHQVTDNYQRPKIPENICPAPWATLIEDCWCDDPQQRPSFKDILHRLRDMKSEAESWEIVYAPQPKQEKVVCA